ncbi:hypothetical protein DFJ77DRAFT_455433 [Powellomyces hirtus]|nr:hypothetical protein DFJ77DRAFT_455433 [Powellomyces hirtus]
MKVKSIKTADPFFAPASRIAKHQAPNTIIMVSFSISIALALVASASSVLGSRIPVAAPSGVIASHNGGTRNLVTDGWGSAAVCTVTKGSTACFDTEVEARAHTNSLLGKRAEEAHHLDARAPNSCDDQFICLYDLEDYRGRKLQIQERAYYDLRKWNFRNKTSSVYNKRSSPCNLIDARAEEGLPSTTKTFYPRIEWTHLGAFDNTADRITCY